MSEDVTVFEAVGGQPFSDGLVDHFYDAVAADPVLLPLYPERDGFFELRESEQRRAA